MTEFTELDLNKDVASMEEEEAKKTLSEFMEAHKTNQSAYDELQTEIDEVETEYSEKLEEKEERISEFKQERAEEAAEYVNIPADLVADRFDFSEIEQIIEEGQEFSDADPEGDDPEDDEDEPLTSFADKPEKGRADSGTSQYRDRARSALANQGMPLGGN